MHLMAKPNVSCTRISQTRTFGSLHFKTYA
jgi:hypothetical protein